MFECIKNNYIIKTDIELNAKIVENLPLDITPYVIQYYHYYQLEFFNFNIPISSKTFYKQCLNNRILGYTTNVIITKDDRSFFYFGVLPVGFDPKYSFYRVDCKPKKIYNPKPSFFTQYYYPKFLLLEPKVIMCQKCKMYSCLLGGCKNATCPKFAAFSIADQKINVSDKLSIDDQLIYVMKDTKRTCLQCLRCKACQKLSNDFCKRHRICRHQKLKIVKNLKTLLNT